MITERRTTNQILAKLPRDDGQRLARTAERVTLGLGEVVCDPGRPIGHAYFPTTGVLSSVVTLENGEVVEAATIGNEGMAGVALLVDGKASPHRVVQQVRGEMVRIPAAAFREALAQSHSLHELTERYALALLQQCGQNVACKAHHNVKQRTCRWLLASRDRVGANEFDITQEYLAQILGVRRQTVGATAQSLQQEGLISYRRGRLKLHDPEALERLSCECYQVTKETYERVMGMPQNGRAEPEGGPRRVSSFERRFSSPLATEGPSLSGGFAPAW